MRDDETSPAPVLVELLTRREREILALLAEGLTGPEIADRLAVATSSVKSHMQHLYGKLGVTSKRQAVTRAYELGLLGPTPAVIVAAPPPAPAGPAPSSKEPAPGESPFMGLRHFDEADAPWFFGREALAAHLAARLSAPAGVGHPAPIRFLAVVGASGSGKSSIVRAGLLPRLRRAAGPAPAFAAIHLLTPTAHPLEALAASLTQPDASVSALATLLDDLRRDARALHLYARWGAPAQRAAAPDGPAPSRLLVVVDQFEELFTLCRGEAERQIFIDNLLYAADPANDGPVTVLITLRADFYPHCAAYAGLRAALAGQQDYIGPMSVEELRAAVERPAAVGG